jgi:hypothetical protein
MRPKEIIIIVCEVFAVFAKAWFDHETRAQHRRKKKQPSKRRPRSPQPKR